MAGLEADLKSSYDYVKEVDEYLCCSICLVAMIQPVVAPCGHSFCRKCIESWLSKRHVARSCPQCRTRVRKDQLQTVVALAKAADALEVYCPMRDKGCKEILKRGALEGHVSKCSFNKVPCPTCGGLTTKTVVESHSREIADRKAASQFMIDDLMQQIETAEEHLEGWQDQNETLKRDLRYSQSRVAELERVSYGRNDEGFDYSYQYGLDQNSIRRLCCFICQNLDGGCPINIDVSRLFNCIHSSNQRRGAFKEDVRMLLATAYASNWFSTNQDDRIWTWLHNLI